MVTKSLYTFIVCLRLFGQ